MKHRYLVGFGAGSVALLLLGLALVGRHFFRTPPPPAAAATPVRQARAATAQQRPSTAQQRPTAVLFITLEPALVRQGGEVHLSGRGFSPGETVAIQAVLKEGAPDSLPLGEVQAADGGVLAEATLQLPEALESGTHVVEAVGQTSQRRTTATLYIRATAPWIVLEGYDVKPAQDLGLVVGGFEPDGRVRLSLETRAEPAAGSIGTPTPQHEPVALGELATDAVGNTAWSTVRMPVVPAGAYTLVARGDSAGQELRRDITVKPFAPVLELSPWAGPPGVRISVNGRGFAPGESVDVVLGEDGRAATTLPADADGNIWGGSGGRVPYEAAPGSLSVALRGQQSGARATAQFKVVEPHPWLELGPWWGPAGVPVGFHGGGWAAGERITFHLDSAMTPTVVEGQADDNGWLAGAGPATVPRDATGKVTFVAVGEQSHAVATATFTVSAPSTRGPGPRLAAGQLPSPPRLSATSAPAIRAGRVAPGRSPRRAGDPLDEVALPV